MSQGQVGSLAIGATPVDPDAPATPVSGNWLTNSQLRASPVPVVDAAAALILTDIYGELTTSNSFLENIETNTANTVGQLLAVNTELNTQTTELQTVNTTLNTISGYVDDVETLLGTAIGILNSSNSLLTHIDTDFHSALSLLADIETEVSLSRGRLENIDINKLNVSLSSRASETTLQSVLTQATTTNTNLTTVIGHVDGLEGLITSSNSKLDTLIAKDFATSAKQDLALTQLTAINANTDTLEASFTTLNAKDFATSAKQDLALAQLTAINANTDQVEAKLDTLIAKDFATTAKQDAQTALLTTANSLQTTNNASLASVDGKLQTQTVGALQRLNTNSTITNPAATFYADVAMNNRLRVNTEPSTMMADKFDGVAFDANIWTSQTSAGGALNIGTGNMSITTGTTTGARAILQTIPLFNHPGNAFIQFGAAMKLEAGALLLNTKRQWGFVDGGNFTYANPFTDGVMYEVTETGELRASIYNTSVRIYSVVLTAPTDGNFHRYDIFYNTQNIAWYIDGLLQAQTTVGLNPVRQTLPGRIAMLNNTVTGPASAPTLQCQAIAFTDTASNNTQISDGTYGFRKAKVSANSDLSTSDVANTAGVNGAITVGVTATLMTANGTTALTNRKELSIFNNSLVTIYYGYSNAVTTATGIPIYPSGFLSLDVGPNITVYCIAGTAGNNTRVAELS